MAEVINSVIGVLKGKVKNYVFREVNGNKASKSAPDRAGRNNFAVTIKFAKSINSLPAL